MLGDDVASNICQALGGVGGLRLAARGAGRGCAAQGQGVCRVRREVGMGDGQWVPTAPADKCVAHKPLVAGAWRCCSGRASTAVGGI